MALQSTGDLSLTSDTKVHVAGGNFQVGVAGGSATATSTQWNTFSDKRLKEEVAGLSTQSMAIVMALRPVSFNWISSGNPDVGFIAQEVRDVLPNFVVEGIDGYLAVNYPRIGVYLVKAFQQLNDAIDQKFGDFEQRLADLEKASFENPIETQRPASVSANSTRISTDDHRLWKLQQDMRYYS